MKVERLLSPHEKMTWLLDQSAPMNFVILAQIKGNLNSEAVRDALDSLSNMHPLLTTHFELRKGKPWVVTDKHSKPALHFITRKNDNHWHVEVEKELNNPFDCYKDSFLRITILWSAEVSEVLFTFYHPISDAHSGVYALRDFLMLLAAWMPGQKLVIPFTHPPRPPVEKLLPPYAHGWLQLHRSIALATKQIHNNFIKPCYKLPLNKVTRKDRETKIIHFVLTDEVIDKITKRCREQKTTVQGALCAALLTATARQIKYRKKLNLSCCSVVNLRSKLHPKLDDEIGMLASAVITNHELYKDLDFWTLARDIKEQITKGIHRGEIYTAMTLIRKLLFPKDTPNKFANRMAFVSPYASTVTNIGKVQIPQDYGSLHLTRLDFSVSLKSFSEEQMHLAVATFGDQMSINFIYTAPNLDASTASKIAEDMVFILKKSSS